MRNLRLLSELLTGEPEFDSTHSVLPYFASTYDGRSFFCSAVSKTDDPLETEVFFHIVEQDGASVVNSQRITGDDDTCLFPNGAEVTGMAYSPDLEAVVIATTEGDIGVIGDNGEQDCAGFVDSGIRCMAWSPDGEIVAFVTGNGTVLEMTKNWDPMTEASILGDGVDEEASSAVDMKPTVNWAKSTLTWRGDGQYFAVGYSGGISVFDRQGVLQSRNEGIPPDDTQSHVIAWKPSGGFIAAHVSRPHRQEIALYERNGLRHGELIVRVPEGMRAETICMSWGSESDVIALLVRLQTSSKDGAVATSERVAVQLYSRNNYHWYLKQQYTAEGIVAVSFDTEVPLLLRALSSSGRIYSFRLCWDTDVDISVEGKTHTPAVVIDGCELLVTSLLKQVVPPPMSSYKIILNAPCNAVGFAASGYGSWVVFTTDYRIVTFGPTPADPETPPRMLSSYNLKEELEGRNVRQLLWPVPGLFIALCRGKDTASVDELVCVETDESASSVTCFAIALPKRSIRLFKGASVSSIFVEMVDGQVLRADVRAIQRDKQSAPLLPVVMLPQDCPWIASVLFQGNDQFMMGSNEDERIVGLSRQHRLFIDNKEVCSSCNSFAIHNHFLLFTTFSHALRIISLRESYAETSFETDPTHLNDVSHREVERGSMLVAAVPRTCKVVLQMPRGNLETIYPRAIVIAAVESLLDTKNFRKAFLTLRRHRIDLNVLYDHNPEAFTENCAEFVEQLESPNYINLFLSDLKDQDIKKKLFPNDRSSKKREEALPQYLKPKQSSGKVNHVCSVMRDALNEKNPKKYLLSILTAYVRSSPPMIEDALAKVQSLRTASTEEPNRFAEALDYLIFLVDVNHLYTVALGMYDLPLAVIVAQKSTMDPQEYLPYLNELMNMEESYRKFRIDVKLKRFQRAVENGSVAGVHHFAEVQSLIEAESLYACAVKVYSKLLESDEQEVHKDHLQKILQSYGDSLTDAGMYEPAALCYLRGNNLQAAQDAFGRACDWRSALAVCYRLKRTDDEVATTARGLAETMRNLGRYEDCHTYGCAELVGSVLLPALLQTHEQNMSQLEEKARMFQRHADRLKIVKTQKILLPKFVTGPDGNRDEEISSIASGVSGTSSVGGSSVTSMSSFQSGTTTSTKRERRLAKKKQRQKRRLSGREGNPREEEWLVHTLKEMIPSPNAVASIHDLVKALIYHHHWDLAEMLQDAFDSFLKLAEEALPLISAPLLQDAEDDAGDTEEQRRARATEAQAREIAQLLMPKTSWKHRFIS